MNKKMSELSRKRWGNRLVCSIKPTGAGHHAYCEYNGKTFVGIGASNTEAVINALTKANEKPSK